VVLGWQQLEECDPVVILVGISISLPQCVEYLFAEWGRDGSAKLMGLIVDRQESHWNAIMFYCETNVRMLLYLF